MATRTKRKTAIQGRRYPRFQLDVDWFVESRGCSTLGRGIELSVRSALLPVTCTSPFTEEVTLYLSLPLRPKMLKIHCTAQNEPRGWVLHFLELSPEDLQLLGHTLVTEFGVAALPNLERRAEHAVDLG